MLAQGASAGTMRRLQVIGLALLHLSLGMLFTSYSVLAQALETHQAGSAYSVSVAWHGVYTYEDLEGRNVSGFFMSVDHRLVIPADTTRPVVLTMQGYQTDTTLRCTITGDSKRAEVRFLGFGDGRVVNEAGNEQYKPGEILFVLARQSQSHTGKALLTEWKAYKPDGARKRRGQYFRFMQPHTQSSPRK